MVDDTETDELENDLVRQHNMLDNYVHVLSL